MLFAVPPAGAQSVDYDDDDDGLIDITTPAQLNAVRHDLNGNGDATHADYVAAFPQRQTGATDRMGCPTGTCAGYELKADLDLSGYANWAPIGGAYTATFEGNGHTISNLTITSNTGDDAGLFGNLSTTGRIYRVGVVNANITGTRASSQELGILAGEVHGIIRFSYTTGTITANSSGTWHKTGGLVGYLKNGGQILASYSTATVVGPTTSAAGQGTGGLVGHNGEAGVDAGIITASYASGVVSATLVAASISSGRLGGLVGLLNRGNINQSYAYGSVTPNTAITSWSGGLVGQRLVEGAVADSYYDRQTSGRSDTGRGAPQTTSDLRRPTGYSGIYANWNLDLSNPADGVNDDPWDFGTRRQYPALKVDFDNDGTATPYEFGRQGRPNPNPPPPSPPPYNPAHDHPEIYTNPRHEMAVSCALRTTGTGDQAQTTSTMTFDLGTYTRPITLILSLWDGQFFRTLQSQNIPMPELRQDGQTATVEVVTDPAQTRFRLDSQYGLNLVLGYADCHTDDP